MCGCGALLSRNLQNREENVTHELKKKKTKKTGVCPVKSDKKRRKAKSQGSLDTGFSLAKKGRFHGKAVKADKAPSGPSALLFQTPPP